MTHPAIIASACEGKHPYATPQQARKVASKTTGLQHYRCPHCGLWHIGNRA